MDDRFALPPPVAPPIAGPPIAAPPIAAPPLPSDADAAASRQPIPLESPVGGRPWRREAAIGGFCLVLGVLLGQLDGRLEQNRSPQLAAQTDVASPTGLPETSPPETSPPETSTPETLTQETSTPEALTPDTSADVVGPPDEVELARLEEPDVGLPAGAELASRDGNRLDANFARELASDTNHSLSSHSPDRVSPDRVSPDGAAPFAGQLSESNPGAATSPTVDSPTAAVPAPELTPAASLVSASASADSDQPLTDQPLTDQPLTDQPLTDQPLTLKPLTLKPLPLAAQPVCEAGAMESLNTALQWASSPAEAFRLANEKNKLVFLIHVSGNFEIPGFT